MLFYLKDPRIPIRPKLAAVATLSFVLLGAADCPRDPIRPNPPNIQPADPQIPTSTVNLPITVSLESVRRLAEGQIPQTEDQSPYYVHINGGGDNCRGNGVSIGYHVERGPIRVSAAGPVITTGADFRYWVRGRARRPIPFGCSPLLYGSCGVDGEPPRTMTASLNTTVAVRPDWTLDAQTTPNPAAAGNRCRVTFLQLDVTDLVLRAFTNALGAGAAALDNQIEQAANLRGRMQQVWSDLSAPVSLDNGVWLVVRPQAAGISPVAGAGDQLRVDVMLQARPEIVLGPQPAMPPVPLPDAVAPAGGNSFDLTVPVTVTYAAISTQLANALRLNAGGIRYPAVGRFYVRPRDVAFYGYGTKAVVRIGFEGSARGVLYFVGTPTYDAVRNVLSFPDLDYTVETRNVLARLVNWREADNVRADLRTRLTIDLGNEVGRARALATQALNRQVGALTLAGQVNTLRVVGVYGRPEQAAFQALVLANGTLNAALP